MGNLLQDELYIEDLQTVCDRDLPWEELRDKTILISGATGMIGSNLIDVLFHKNIGVRVVALGRSEEKGKKRFEAYWDKEEFRFVACDITRQIPDTIGDVDYIFHAASSTHPKAYSTMPIATITANITGTDLLLEYGSAHGMKRFVFASSVEVYGENRGDTDKFAEDYCGYIDCNTLRAGYPESKRAGEALCQAYKKEKGIEVVLPRLSRTYGPTLLASDTKAISQFIHKGVDKEDIVLKSEGTQLYSYSYVSDAVSGVLYTMLCGENGEAYNISDEGSDITLRDLAALIADYAGKKVVFELPDETERAGYSTATKALLDNSKIRKLGWSSDYDIKKGITRTIEMLRKHG